MWLDLHDFSFDCSKCYCRKQMTVYYPSGKRTAFVPEIRHRNICRAIYRGQNVEKCIIDIISKSHPETLTSATSNIISAECEAICKRGSGSILQDRSYSGIFNFHWDKFHDEIQLKAPQTLKVISSALNNIPIAPGEKKYTTLMHIISMALHGRNQEMSSIHYQIGFILTHGACKQRDIERLAKLGLTVNPRSVQNKLSSWEDFLDTDLVQLKEEWKEGVGVKYQMIGDNWDKNILPSYRTSQDKTLSLHLFQVIAVVDRIVPENKPVVEEEVQLNHADFIPSISEQEQLKKELSFLVATSVIQNIDQMKTEFESIFPSHLEHDYSDSSGIKTKQFPLGLFDCNENKTQQVIRLLKQLTEKYVPLKDNGEVIDEVFFGGDRLTDERIQSAQQAMSNGDTPKEKLQGFISKIEDWHRMMNFLEAICKLTYAQSTMDRGTACYFRNFLNLRNVKAEVKNAFRAYKLLYYTIFDACCCILFMKRFNTHDLEGVIEMPSDFKERNSEQKVQWLLNVCSSIVEEWFFENTDMFQELREILEDPDHPENYWVLNEEGRFPCHFCIKTYSHVGSLKTHERICHQHNGPKIEKKKKAKTSANDDQLFNYIILLFKLTGLLKNLDTAIDMADGRRSVRSAKYELPIFNTTNKLKYVIGCIHLTALSEETLSPEQRDRLILNRTVNLQGGKNNNLALDEYVEMLNRDSKDIVTGHQTKESIIAHSKQYPHLINYIKHFDIISEIRQRKGFHKLPQYKADVMKVAKELIEIRAFEHTPKRKFVCKDLSTERNPFINSYRGLSTMINRHKPKEPFSRLRDKHQ
ncbi:uncharacterized protein [Mytilus edulis]|uniref:uncharacterized protein n=1 Tax=Mytilus edulis TaxID=6550 RepID=UPI0039EE2E59